MKTNQKIIDYLKEYRQTNAQELADYLGITDRGVRKQLLVMLRNGILTKKGRPPVVYYQLNTDSVIASGDTLPTSSVRVINQNFLFITPTGEKLEGISGFEAWCQKHNLSLVKTSHEYVAMLKKFSQYKKQGFINGLAKLKRTYDQVYLDNLYYLDFYSIDRFGKTKLGQLLLYAKQS
ncbi:MAG TPA: hypothetical protein DEP87_01090, partial [Candidatus Pacebacteria bacterium]|nr:hypothetical protein [Candidatus Paceibacterota bacterium]